MRQKKSFTIKRTFIATLLCLFTLLFSLLPFHVYANSELNFYVQPKLPESQLEGTSSYFDVNLAPGTSEDLVIELSNPTDKEVEIQLSVHTAYTNVNGVVEYGQDPTEADDTLVYQIPDLLEVPEPITLGAYETKEVTLKLTMPEDAFEGLLAGGIRIEEVPTEDEEESEGFAVTNAFAYVLGLVASNERTKIEPELDLLDVFADQVNYRNVFSATIQNPLPIYVNQLEVEAKIRELGTEETLYEASRSGMQMAPNSRFDFPISLEGDAFRNGTYVADITARSGSNEWTWEYEFTVDNETARRLNKADVTIEETTNWWLIAAIACIVLLIALVAYLLYKNKKQQGVSSNTEEERKSGNEKE